MLATYEETLGELWTISQKQQHANLKVGARHCLTPRFLWNDNCNSNRLLKTPLTPKIGLTHHELSDFDST